MAEKKRKFPIWIIVVIVVFFIIGGGIKSNSQSSLSKSTTKSDTPAVISYDVCDIDTMEKELNDNSLAASEKYKGKYIEVKGKLQTIDSDGKYISIESTKAEFTLFSLHCSITDASQRDFIKQIKKGDTITIKGKVTMVGELLGYSLDIKEISK